MDEIKIIVDKDYYQGIKFPEKLKVFSHTITGIIKKGVFIVKKVNKHG